jgi:3-dehydroquinate dehydratase/shikimate dehydrogenase
MICISINQESRRLALVDMLNASRQCDLLEIRLDRFGMAPGLSDLLAAKPKPAIMSCRRVRDGGSWDGSEEERLALLRQCVISKAEYIEIELDVADQVRRFPPSKRVISYTNLRETPANLAEIYAEAQRKDPDVIKLTTLARTPEEAWPLVQILARSPVPTVVAGLGKPGIMLTVLGKKIGAPWTYAALERGMEAYPGQPTVHDLETVYHYRAIERGTRLVGVTGFGEREYATVAALNGAMANLGLPARCLPLGVGDMRLFRKVMEAVKLAGVVVSAEHQESVLEIATQLQPSAQQARAADLLLHKDEHWHGYHTLGQAAAAVVGAALKDKTSTPDNPLRNRMVMIAGINATARGIGLELQRRGAGIIFASRQAKAAQQLAQELACRHVVFDGLYTTTHDTLIVCDEEKVEVKGKAVVSGIHPGYLKPGMVVMDLAAGLRLSPLLREAQARGCTIVTPRQLLLEHLQAQARLLTGKQVPAEVLASACPAFGEDEQ